MHLESIGEIALNEITKSEGESKLGTVLNVFKSTAYIKTISNELIILTTLPLKSPITMNLNYRGNLKSVLKPLAKIKVRDGKLQTNGFTASLVEAKKYVVQKQCLNADVLFSILEKDFRNILSLLNLELYNASITWLKTYQVVTEKFMECLNETKKLKNNLQNSILNFLTKIIGLGPGFTPSGDDFAAGFLFIFNTFSPLLKLKKIKISNSILFSHTNWVSGKIVDYIQRGIADEVLYKVLCCLKNLQRNSLTDSFLDLISRGHTTGVDLAMGFLAAISFLQDTAYNSSLTSKLILFLLENTKQVLFVGGDGNLRKLPKN